MVRIGSLWFGICALAVLASSFKDGQANESDAWVTVKGKVILEKPYEPSLVNVVSDKEHCLSKGPLLAENVIVNKQNKGLKNVVVWFRPDSTDRKAVLKKEDIKPELQDVKPVVHEIDQPCCQFVPRVLAVRAGDGLIVKNSSPVPHNIKYNGENTFNVNIPAGMSHRMATPFTPTNVPVSFECNVHPWMTGRVRIFDHPYFAITNDDGEFEIKDVPVGKWRLVYWHEDGFHKGRDGILGFPIEVKGPLTTAETIAYEFPK